MTDSFSILAFDTALGGCGVAVFNAVKNKVFSDLRPMNRGQSELLVPMVETVMKEAGLDYPDLGLIVTTTGPGAFTGLRIGLSAARSFALALSIPIAGVSTMEVLAGKFFKDHTAQDRNLLVIIETKRSDLYVQRFQNNAETIDNAAVLSIESLLEQYGGEKLSLCGDGVGRLRETLAEGWPPDWQHIAGYELPDPVILAEIGRAQQAAGILQPADPVYLRDADVSLSTRPARKIAESAAGEDH